MCGLEPRLQRARAPAWAALATAWVNTLERPDHVVLGVGHRDHLGCGENEWPASEAVELIPDQPDIEALGMEKQGGVGDRGPEVAGDQHDPRRCQGVVIDRVRPGDELLKSLIWFSSRTQERGMGLGQDVQIESGGHRRVVDCLHGDGVHRDHV
jgi:hypothetical protein